MASKPKNWNLETEVLVVGTGASGLTAAIVAHDTGAKVTIIEKTDKVGGSTAVSGGVPWIPNNHHANDVDYGQGQDSREKALSYIKGLSAGKVKDELIEAFIDTGPEMIKYIEENTTLKFILSKNCDYYPEHPGGMKAGRSLGPIMFDTKELGDSRGSLRMAPIFFLPMNWDEVDRYNVIVFPKNIDFHMIAQRMNDGLVGMGMATVGHLFKATIDRGINTILMTRAIELVSKDGRIIGLLAEQGGKDFYIHASKGVILATGGFEWNANMKVSFLPGANCLPCSPPYNEGDGQKMAMAVGADLGNMSECWGTPVSVFPGEEYEGRQLNRLTLGERYLPHTIMVNRYGKRFVNESHNYNDIYKSFLTFDPVAYDYSNIPAWCILDQQFKDKYSIMTIMPDDPAPSWLNRSDSLEDLAKKTGIDQEGLKATVKRFNEFAVEGVDHDFKRGQSYHDTSIYGDPNQKPNPCLGTIMKSPFYALPVYPGTLGTKGGAKTNTKGQVLNVQGEIIEGLYAAGNVMACVTGPGYCGPGGTIGPGMTWGYICGRHAAQR